MLIFGSFYSSKNPEKICSTVLNIDNNNYNKNIYWTANQHIRMISEGSCDTEDLSSEAENVVLITGINYIWNVFKQKAVILRSKNIPQYSCFGCILDQINAGLVSKI